jgi:hypothetical protein
MHHCLKETSTICMTSVHDCLKLKQESILTETTKYMHDRQRHKSIMDETKMYYD